MNYTDEQLIRLSQDGDREAFGELYSRHNQAIYRFVFFRVFNQQLAEDITAETFIKALQAQHSFNPQKGLFLVWLYRIARNNLFDHYRKHKDTEDISEMQVKDLKNLEKDVQIKITLEKVKELLEKLPEKQKEIIMLRVWGDLSYLEIAKITNSSEASCKMAYSRALKSLQEKADILSIVVSLYLSFYK